MNPTIYKLVSSYDILGNYLVIRSKGEGVTSVKIHNLEYILSFDVEE